MTVEKSKDSNLVGETTIPTSGAVDIEKMIDGIALTKEHVCLKGRFYKFNFNLLNISPDGKRFEVTALENEVVCLRI